MDLWVSLVWGFVVVGLVSKVGVRFWLLLERERERWLYFENGLYSFCPLRVLYFLFIFVLNSVFGFVIASAIYCAWQSVFCHIEFA